MFSNSQIQPAGVQPDNAAYPPVQYSNPATFNGGPQANQTIYSQPTPYTGVPQGVPQANMQVNMQANQVMMANQAIALSLSRFMFRESPVRTQCQFCNADIVTTTEREIGRCVYVAMIILICMGFFLGCCLIPLFIDGCKDVVHTCPNCHQEVGRYTHNKR